MGNPKPRFADDYNAAYAFHKKWGNVADTVENWEKIIDDSGEVRKKAGNTNLITNLTAVAMEEIDDFHRGRSKSCESDFIEYHIKMLRIAFGVKTNEELAKKIVERGG